jgi:hypothetical protein
MLFIGDCEAKAKEIAKLLRECDCKEHLESAAAVIQRMGAISQIAAAAFDEAELQKYADQEWPSADDRTPHWEAIAAMAIRNIAWTPCGQKFEPYTGFIEEMGRICGMVRRWQRANRQPDELKV